MSTNLLSTTAASMAFFVAGSWAIVAGETAKPLPFGERVLLSWTTLGMLAEARGGMVSEEDVVLAAWMYATDDREFRSLCRKMLRALHASQ
jgi:hypothetical protein